MPFDADEIEERLYLGSELALAAVLARLPGIPAVTDVLQICDEPLVDGSPSVLCAADPGGTEASAAPEFLQHVSTSTPAPGLRLVTMRLNDAETVNLRAFLPVALTQLRSMLSSSDRTVLVVCRMGVSRSASLVIAYLMEKRHWSLSDALLHVRRRRPWILPNPGFLLHLMLLDPVEDWRRRPLADAIVAVVRWSTGWPMEHVLTLVAEAAARYVATCPSARTTSATELLSSDFADRVPLALALLRACRPHQKCD